MLLVPALAGAALLALVWGHTPPRGDRSLAAARLLQALLEGSRANWLWLVEETTAASRTFPHRPWEFLLQDIRAVTGRSRGSYSTPDLLLPGALPSGTAVCARVCLSLLARLPSTHSEA